MTKILYINLITSIFPHLMSTKLRQYLFRIYIHNFRPVRRDFQTHAVFLLETEFIPILLPQNRDLKICTPCIKYLKFAFSLSKVCDGPDCPTNIRFYGKLVTFLYEVCPKIRIQERHPIGSRINHSRCKGEYL